MKMTINDTVVGKKGERVPEDLKHIASQILLYISNKTDTAAHRLIENISIEFKTATTEKSWMVFHIAMRLPQKHQLTASWEWDRRHAIALNKKIFLEIEPQDRLQEELREILAHYQDKCVTIHGSLFDPASAARALFRAMTLFVISRLNMLNAECDMLERGEKNLSILTEKE